ncbi:fibrinogen and fibronectin [Culex quinquefasciatus]|uniref:Fibrinogen and fibronectin n=1 Tax=Culex quinquefasciatus TaxID=7176 RepID=B0X1M1_CULQU|nr:fibrinogen and fibronectin [Culex quinquefasciatus]|eukprot:XP_001863543.1 fibrinogen and fibronectin [Culex quinquefasciatus]
MYPSSGPATKKSLYRATTRIPSQSSTITCSSYRLEQNVQNSSTSSLPQTCSLLTNRNSGIQLIHPQPGFRDPFEVFCDQEYEGGGWIVIQNRYDGSVHFYRDWDEYERGFGNLNREFWLGLRKIHELTYSRRYELHVILEDWDGIRAIARYSDFLMAGPKEMYELRIPQTPQHESFLRSSYQKVTVPCNRPNSIPILQNHVQLVPSRVSQFVNLPQPKPKLPVHIAKSTLILAPPSIKVHISIVTILDHNPASTLVLLVAEHLEGIPELWLWVDQLDAGVTICAPKN